ncbi:hypothetical protein BH11BAC3_BH11BAC3_18770 [soil metagenome]
MYYSSVTFLAEVATLGADLFFFTTATGLFFTILGGVNATYSIGGTGGGGGTGGAGGGGGGIGLVGGGGGAGNSFTSAIGGGGGGGGFL